MSYFDPQLMLYAIVFLAVMLFANWAYGFIQDQQAATARVNKRLRVLAASGQTEAMHMALRRTSEERSFLLLPPAVFGSLSKRMTQAGMKMSPERMVLTMAGITLGLGVVFPLIAGIAGQLRSLKVMLLILMFAASLGVALPLTLISRAAAKRLGKFEAQFPVAIDILVRGLRAGHPVSSALALLVEEVPDPIGSEFGTVLAEMNYGYDLRGALANLAGRINTADVNMFVVSVAIQAETGGSLADILDGLSRVIRERASMVLKVRALSSEGKMTGMLLSFLPAATFCFIFATQPDFYLSVIHDPWFMPGIFAILMMYFTGITLMNRMIKIKV